MNSEKQDKNKSKISKAIKLGMIALKGIELREEKALSFLNYCIDYTQQSNKKSRQKDNELFKALIG